MRTRMRGGGREEEGEEEDEFAIEEEYQHELFHRNSQLFIYISHLQDSRSFENSFETIRTESNNVIKRNLAANGDWMIDGFHQNKTYSRTDGQNYQTVKNSKECKHEF